MNDWEYTVLIDHDGASIWCISPTGYCSSWRYSCSQISWMCCAMPRVCVFCIFHYRQLSLHTPVSPIGPIYQCTNPHLLSLMLFFRGHSRYMCNFGPEDKSSIVPHDIQALLKSTLKKKQKMLQEKKRGKKVVLEYESFPLTKSTRPKATRIGKILAKNSVKWGRQHCFVAKKPNLDHSLCLLIYKIQNIWMSLENIVMAPWLVDLDMHLVLGYQRKWN